MNRATPQMRGIAERLIASERPEGTFADAAAPTKFPVTAKLHPLLATLVGKSGVRALLARALLLASAEVPWLRAARVSIDGGLDGLEAIIADLDPAVLAEGRVVLLAQLLGLLVALIGPGLTSRLIGELWPQIPLEQRDFSVENDDEKVT